MNETEKTKFQPFMKNMAFYLPALVGLLYVHGGTFRAAYLGYWGLPPELFKLGFEDTIALGGVSYFILGIYVLFITPMFGLTVFMTASVVNDITKIHTVKEFLGRSNITKEGKVQGHQVTESVTKFARLFSIKTALILVLLIALLFMFEFVSNQGVESAKSQHVRLVNSKVKSLVQFNGEEFIGNIIQCGDQFCAALIDSKVIILPNDLINKISSLAPSLDDDDLNEP